VQPENEVSVTPVSVQTAMSLNGHGTNERTDGRTDRQADRRTDGLADTLDGDVTSESFQCTQTFSGYDVARNMARMSKSLAHAHCQVISVAFIFEMQHKYASSWVT